MEELTASDLTGAGQHAADESHAFRVLALAPNAWNGPWMNRQQLLSRLGRRHVVLYSSGTADRASEFSAPSPTQLRPRLVRQDNVTVDILPAWMSFLLRRPFLGDSTMRSLTRRWKRYLDAQGDGPLLGWFFHPKFWPYVECVNPDRLVYHAYDLYHLQGQWDRARADYERQFVTHADLVLTSSAQIASYLSELGARDPVVVENAVDYSAFAIDTDRTPAPHDLARVPHPRLGYSGTLNKKVDFPLLVWLARRRPEWHIVLLGNLGNLDAETEAAWEELRRVPNVHVLGFKPHQELPAYVGHMDVNLLAYRLAPGLWTQGIYPLKMHEYLAAGPPVVSADLPTVRSFENVIHIAMRPEDWENAIAASLGDGARGTRENRRAVARANDWEARVEMLAHTIERLNR